MNNAERNFFKELDHIKSIHKMEKEQIEHRAQKAIQDLQILQIDHSKLIQNSIEREPDQQVEILNDQLKEQERILLQLENHTNMLTDRHFYETKQLHDKIGQLEEDLNDKRRHHNEVRD